MPAQEITAHRGTQEAEDAILTANPPQKERKPFRKPVGALSKLSADVAKFAADYDIPPKQAYQAIVGKPPHPTTLRNIEGAVEKWSLRHPDSLKAASKTIKAFAAGKEINGIKPKKDKPS